ncbi:MAG: UDP-N-acetylglucosamine--N-acetylmuramyl-(pentapeptide) pyrophosphoryl-undecaprenol N-acetylglucosamine transferase [Actinomycetaceae bacterium]|nr:UDP-N-acetylglucosamine--N-acetylmuramyl-(pentapeptide) pyrophosphoryl-undecaprenol N-acetylglucosamine transferase [Actinomycetaceae bacterium]
MPELRVVLAGGGTAGHVNPLLSLAHSLRDNGVEVSIVGTREGLETSLVPQAGFTLEFIERVPFPRAVNGYMFTFPFLLRKAVKQAKEILLRHQADVLVGFGGYVSTPMYMAARSLGISYVIHEQNAKPGMANKMGARHADVLALTFESTPLQAKKGQTKVVGLPLRTGFARVAKMDIHERAAYKEEVAHSLGIDASMPTLVITGGSLGAHHINEVVAHSLQSIVDERIQVLHITGRGKSDDVKKKLEDRGGYPHYYVREYIEHMEDVYACADLVLCRSGAGTVAELVSLGVPAFFVPLAIGNGEQELNAHDVVTRGGAFLIKDKDFDENVFINRVLPLLHNEEELQKMAVSSRSLQMNSAADELTHIVMKLGVGERHE